MAPPGQPKKPDVSAAAKERNEYIPSFIAKKPFYVPDTDDAASSGDYLEHQRLQASAAQADSKWYERGKKLGPAATKFRKGACENCGAMTHTTKECLYRKRKAGAKWTGKDIQADEAVQDVNLGWDAKRDRWNGYEASDYQAVVDEFNTLEDMKKKAGGADGEEDGDEGAKYEEEADMGRQQAKSTRNLRLREDTAKYLLNLDLDSAKYDPKTRSMVDTGAVGSDAAGKLVAEEGFMRASGDAAEFERAQRYAWETQQRGDRDKIHIQANPTSGEVMRKKKEQETAEKREKSRKTLAEKYGDQSQVQRALMDVEVKESERYVEYDESGGIKGAPKKKAKSKYPEDVYTNNHTSVWGSWWSNFQWGYACCHSTVKNSYCTGEEGRRAFEEASKLRSGLDVDEVPKQIAWQEEAALEEHVPNGVDEDSKAQRDDKARKRAFEEMRGGITEDDMEEYRKKKASGNDPMAAMLGRDELVS